ncbi:hypothetical protein, partial [Cupriavidus lacunae]|uniref:hypothetical protein n=1 Tax=Cupriavidus lacunae TaxID=2666307 RepID=UPI001ABF079F
AARRKIGIFGADALPIAESAAAIVSALQKTGHTALPRSLLGSAGQTARPGLGAIVNRSG